MQRFFLFRSKARRLCLLLITLFAVGLPVGCSVLEQKERELVFRIEPGAASWFSGLPRGVEELQLTDSAFGDEQNIHAWWWPAADADADAPALLYLHGVRWNLTGHLFRLEQLRALGFSVLAIDYRGFGQSLGDLPSERSVYADARIGWERLKALQPDASKRFIYGHSLGGAVAVDLAAELGQQAERDETPAASAGADHRIDLHLAGRRGDGGFRHHAAGALAAVAEIRLDRQDRPHRHAAAGGTRHR